MSSNPRFTDLSELTQPHGSPASTSQKKPKKRLGLKSGKKLMPIDIKDSVASRKKRISQKKDMVDAVRKAQLSCPSPVNTREHIKTTIMSQSVNTMEVPEEELKQREVATLEDGVNQNARKYNDHRMLGDKKQKELNKLNDELNALELETTTLEKIQNKQTPNSEAIRNLEKCIVETTESMEEKAHYRKQLEHMNKRLSNNQVQIDSHLRAMEETVAESEKELTEVKILQRQLEAAKAKAMHILSEQAGEYELDAKERARTLGDRESEARNAKRMEVWRNERIVQRNEMAAELRGDLSKEEEDRLLLDLQGRVQESEQLKVANKEFAEEAANLENLFTQIRQITGVSTMADILDKFHGQRSNHASLESEKSTAEVLLAKAKSSKEAALQSFVDLKASGIGEIEMNREVYNKLEAQYLQAKARLKITKASYERLEGVLSGISQGINGLVERLVPCGTVLEVSDEVGIHRTGDEQLDCIATVEAKLVKIIEVCGNNNSSGASVNNNTSSTGGAYGATGGADSVHDDESSLRSDNISGSSIGPWTPVDNDDPMSHQNNVRVQSLVQMMRSENDHRYDNSVIPSMTHGDNSDQGQSAAAAAVSTDDSVPTRQFLKKCSNRQYAEVSRSTVEASEDEKEVLDTTPTSILKKQQAESGKRLTAAPQARTGLPPGIKQKDDAMTKTKAFLTQTPEFLS